MQSKATTVRQYLDALPADRRKPIEAVRRVIRANLDPRYQEGMQYGMIGYFVPHSVYPPGYHCDPRQPLPFVGLASQKNHMAIYLYCLYADPAEVAWFEQAWTEAMAGTGKKLDMGKSCVRFRKLEDVPLDVVGQAVKRAPVDVFVALYEAATRRPAARASKPKTGKKAAKKSAKKARKNVKKKTAKKTAKKPATRAAKKTAKKTARRSKATAARKTPARRATRR